MVPYGVAVRVRTTRGGQFRVPGYGVDCCCFIVGWDRAQKPRTWRRSTPTPRMPIPAVKAGKELCCGSIIGGLGQMGGR